MKNDEQTETVVYLMVYNKAVYDYISISILTTELGVAPCFVLLRKVGQRVKWVLFSYSAALMRFKVKKSLKKGWL